MDPLHITHHLLAMSFPHIPTDIFSLPSRDHKLSVPVSQCKLLHRRLDRFVIDTSRSICKLTPVLIWPIRFLVCIAKVVTGKDAADFEFGPKQQEVLGHGLVIVASIDVDKVQSAILNLAVSVGREIANELQLHSPALELGQPLLGLL